jgi:hypothetical protein
MPLLRRKASMLDTLAIGYRPLTVALAVGLGSVGLCDFANALAPMAPASGLIDRGHVLKVHSTHRDCRYGVYRQDGRRREGWHRHEDGDTYPCTPGTSRGDRGSGSSGEDRVTPSTPPSFGAKEATGKVTGSRTSAHARKVVSKKGSKSKKK